MVVHADPEALHAAREQGLWPEQSHLGSQQGQQQEIGTSHPTVADVPANRHFQALDAPFTAPNGEGIQQGLGGVLVHPVARVDDRGSSPIGHIGGGAGTGVSDHHDVGVHRVQGGDRVAQGLPLAGAGGGPAHVHDVGPQPLAGQLEGAAGAGGGLEEEVEDGLAAQGGDLADGSLGHQKEGLGQLQDSLRRWSCEALDAEQVTQAVFTHGFGSRGGGGVVGHEMGRATTTVRWPSDSTSTRSFSPTRSLRTR